MSGTTRENVKVAIFRRVDTMPTFASHWAGVSGSIEENERPWEAAKRELHEETNLSHLDPDKLGGLFVDVHFKKSQDRETIIRVYPFTVKVNDSQCLALELKGTEHDQHKFVSIMELETLQPTVPALAKAFHHATHGQFLANVCSSARDWAGDTVNGAAIMARHAIQIVREGKSDAETLKIMRPSMVAIVNVLNTLQKSLCTVDAADKILTVLKKDLQRSSDFAVQTIQTIIETRKQQLPSGRFRIATHSRSSNVLSILKRLISIYGDHIDVVCSKSSPGDEGIVMAGDLNVEWIEDADLLARLHSDAVDLLLVGCDCLTEQDVVNKVGTCQLANAKVSCKVMCCLDRWKLWNDKFPPPLESIFECVPRELFDEILLPPEIPDE
jgi:translation initiation factor 2B subunit (eIF-2B alpha/beta/delta family)/8-oxo-dGTP pyrophosphatase MutT (NUDIX family)